MREELRHAAAALESNGDSHELLELFYRDCTGEVDTMNEWIEWIEMLSSTQLLTLCKSLLGSHTVDKWTIASFTALLFERREANHFSKRVLEALSVVIVELHDELLQTTCLETQEVIAKLCETSWTTATIGADRVVTQLLPYLLVRALESEATQSIGFIKRLCDVQDAMQLLDFEDASSRLLKDLLLRCFVTPNFLKSGEGVAFLSGLFLLDASFLEEIHLVIRNQIPQQSKSVLKRYGLVYFKAWFSAAQQPESDIVLAIEEDCIQFYIQAATFASTMSHFTSLRAILQPFFENKKYTDEMLYRLSEPILWRALHAANDVVRYHAAVLLFEGFPYQDPSFLREEMDACLQKQFDAFSMLLEDLAPTVRVVAVHGICKVLSMYWELLPADTIRKCLLKCFELVHDISSYTIRVAVIDGLLLVLENHLSHLILKPLLPQLAPFIHDKQEKVRAAIARLLVRVKSIRHMHFYDIVSIDECFRRLVLDKAKPSVVKPLTELFMNSYFPQGASGSSQVARALSLIEKYPTASLVFYRNVYHFASVGSVCKLVVLLFKCLSEDIEEQIIVTTCDVMLALLESIQAPLYKDRRYAECVGFLTNEISPSHLVTLFQSAKPIVISRLWHVIANLPPNNQEELLFHALTQLEKLNEASSKVYLAGILNALRRWGQLPTFLDTLVESFQSQTDLMDPALVIACLEVLFGSEMTVQWSDDDGPLVSSVTQLADALTRQWSHLDANVLPRLARILFSIALQRAIPHAKALVAEYKKGPMQENSVVFPFLDFVPPKVLMDMVHHATPTATKKKRKQSQTNPDLVLEMLPVLLDTSWICATQLFEPSSMAFMVEMVSLAHENSTIATQFLAMLWTNPCISKDANSQEFVATTTVDLLRIVLLEESSLWLLELIMKRGVSKRSFWQHVLTAMTLNSSIASHLKLSSWKPLMDAAIEKAALDNDSNLLATLVENIPEAQEAAKAWTSRQTRANLDLLPPSRREVWISIQMAGKVASTKSGFCVTVASAKGLKSIDGGVYFIGTSGFRTFQSHVARVEYSSALWNLDLECRHHSIELVLFAATEDDGQALGQCFISLTNRDNEGIPVWYDLGNGIEICLSFEVITTTKEHTVTLVDVPVIPVSELTILSSIGRGAYGTVERGVYLGMAVAIKRLHVMDIKQFQEDAKLYHSITSPYIVSLIGISISKSDYTTLQTPKLIFEFISKGDLRTYHYHKRLSDVQHTERVMPIQIALDIALGLSYLHDRSLLHGELRPCNIMLIAENHVKLTDLRIPSAKLASFDTLMSYPWMYVAPEVLVSDRFSSASDIFSFGVLLTELETWQIPYSLRNGRPKEFPFKILHEVLEGYRRPEFSTLCSPWLQQLGKQCMAKDPQLRPSMTFIVQRLSKKLPKPFVARKSDKTIKSSAAPKAPISIAAKNKRAYATTAGPKLFTPREGISIPIILDAELSAIERLGSGPYGYVEKAVYKRKHVAVKAFMYAPEKFEQAALILGLIPPSPYIVNLVGVNGIDSDTPRLVSEFMDLGDCQAYLARKRRGISQRNQFSNVDIALAIAKALAHLHKHDILHRDVRSMHVMLSSQTESRIKLKNFTSAKHRDDLLSAKSGSSHWMSPEMLIGNDYGVATDIYSFGVFLTELDTCNRPFAGIKHMTNFSILDQIQQGLLRPELSKNCQPWYKELAMACMAQEPKDRPTAESVIEILNHHQLDST